MTRTLALISFLAAGLITVTPGLAAPLAAVPDIHPYETHTPRGGWIPWDPSFNERHYGLDQGRRLGRCVEDLGYGRYEYCD